ncbi:MAG: hypothetical protein U0232_18295 [Thermomicrobiales bacterium]
MTAAPSAAGATATRATGAVTTPATGGTPAGQATPGTFRHAGATGMRRLVIVAAANAFLATLDSTKKTSVQFD